MRARQYQPTWGRFLSPDPIAIAGGPSLYAFTGSRPLQNRDVMGLISCDLNLGRCYLDDTEAASIGAAGGIPFSTGRASFGIYGLEIGSSWEVHSQELVEDIRSLGTTVDPDYQNVGGGRLAASADPMNWQGVTEHYEDRLIATFVSYVPGDVNWLSGGGGGEGAGGTGGGGAGGTGGGGAGGPDRTGHGSRLTKILRSVGEVADTTGRFGRTVIGAGAIVIGFGAVGAAGTFELAGEAALAAKNAAEALAQHHPWPKYLGGPEKQPLYPLPRWLHNSYHKGLDRIFGRHLRTDFYAPLANDIKQQIYIDLANYTREFDAVYGTQLYEALYEVLRMNGIPLP